MLVELIEAPVFTRLVGSYLSDDDYRLLQWTLAKGPERGDVREDAARPSRFVEGEVASASPKEDPECFRPQARP